MNVRLLLLSFTLFVFACGNEQKPGVNKPATLPPQYYYFPRANVYFDSANKEYLFLTADSSSWEKSKQIPAVVQSLMDKSVYIGHPSQPVWKDNDKHKLVYSALLYATPADTVEKKAPVITEAAKPVITPSADSINNALEKKRSGVRRFFDKIFGGLKKKKKDTAQ